MNSAIYLKNLTNTAYMGRFFMPFLLFLVLITPFSYEVSLSVDENQNHKLGLSLQHLSYSSFKSDWEENANIANHNNLSRNKIQPIPYPEASASFLTQINSIIINNNSELISKSLELGIAGDGSKNNPFIFKNLLIENYSSSFISENSGLIFINNTNMFIEFRDSVLRGGLNGIKIQNSINIIISNLSISNNLDDGILLRNATISIDSTEIFNCSNHGINSLFDSEIKIKNSIIHDVHYNGINNIRLENTNNLIHNNTIYNCQGRGINNEVSNNFNITHNLVYNNKKSGLSFGACSNYSISYNTFYNNTEPGITSSIVSDIQIQYNNFIYNSPGFNNAGQLDYCEVIDNDESDFSYNFWASFQGIDENKDNISDTPLTAYSMTKQDDFIRDATPLMHPIIEMRMLIHINPIFWYGFFEYEFLSNEVKLNWTSYQNTYNLPINHYSVNFIQFNSETINLSLDYNFILNLTEDKLASMGESITCYNIINESNALRDNEYIFDTRLIPDGEYLIELISTDIKGNYNIIFHHSKIIVHNHLSNFTITYPKKGDYIIQKEFYIYYNPSIDQYNHSIYYALYYSSDNGSTWIDLHQTSSENRIRFNIYNEYIKEVPRSKQARIKLVAICDKKAQAYAISEVFSYMPLNYFEQSMIVLSFMALSLICIVVITNNFAAIKNRKTYYKENPFIFRPKRDSVIFNSWIKITLLLMISILPMLYALYMIIRGFLAILEGQLIFIPIFTGVVFLLTFIAKKIRNRYLDLIDSRSQLKDNDEI